MAGIFCFMFPKAEWLHAQLCESPSDIYPKVKSILVQQFKVKPTKITLSATLGNTLGLDSLHRVELFITLEETFNMEIPDTRCSAATTLRDIVSTIRSIRSRRCEGFAQSMTCHSTANIYRRVTGIVVEQLGVDPKEVTLSANFVDDLGVDSLDTVELVMAFEEAFDIEIPDETAEKTRTVGDAVRLIKSLTCKQ